jgi:transposase
MRTSREEWAKRVQRWQDSDLTAAEFAAEVGINPRTLSYWKWRLGKESRERKTTRARKNPVKKAPAFVEVTPPTSTRWRATERIEVVVDDRVVVRVPDTFDSGTLRRVVAALTSGEGRA